MDRNTKHSPRVDEQIDHDVAPLVTAGEESRSDPGRLQEGAGDDDPVPGRRFADEAASPGALSAEEAERRSELASVLRPSAFPAARSELIDLATEEHASERVVDLLRGLPDDRFENVEAIWEAAGGRNETAR